MDDALLLAHMEDLAQKAQKRGMAHSNFLSPGQAAAVESAYGTRQDVLLRWDGGFEEAERRVAVFLQPQWGEYLREEVVAAICLSYRRQDTLRHQDVMGAVLGLGLSRQVLGDIAIAPPCAYVVCLAGRADFIVQQLAMVGRVGVSAQVLPLSQLPALAPALEEKQITVASLRLDAIVAAAFGLSRSAAATAIAAGRVQLAHHECQNPSQPVQPGNTLSLRGKGRVKLLAEEGTSKKGRLRIVLGYYG